jgi:hypothetical protein
MQGRPRLSPIAAASGGLAARRSAQRSQETRVEETGTVYSRGLGHLLNERPDKALEAFIKPREDDEHSVEMHMALTGARPVATTTCDSIFAGLSIRVLVIDSRTAASLRASSTAGARAAIAAERSDASSAVTAIPAMQ